MKYLEKLYIQELNSTENDRVQIVAKNLDTGAIERRILIDGNEFIPSTILDDDYFSQSFQFWKKEQKDISLSKADEILSHYENQKRFEKLIQSNKANNIIPFVGAGMSIPSEYPGWTSFLYKLQKETSFDINTLDELIGKGLYEEAAQLIYDDLGAGVFNEHLEIEFSRDKDVQGSINLIPFLFKENSVITTNFDSCIEKVYADNDLGFDNTKSGKYLNEIIRQLAGGSKFLIKLHGTADQVADRVLTSSEYTQAYSEDINLISFFNRILIRNSLLFLGCSLSTDRTINTMKAIVKKEGADSLPRHYAFLEEIKDSKKRREKKKYLAEANIFPIWYPEDTHDESIEALLTKLLNSLS
jgi:hypothetical protein